ncbi:MAG TPA: aspartate-semialdehyde dehydrogenase [Vicinamibacteria bacterium]|nr:aspartate-semialdehyde dehydrogenase [Vicinamibacteria bacterium]
MRRIPVGILGATGAVGQRFVQLLADHPWFEIAELAASDRSAGKAYREACTWRLATAPPDRVAGMVVKSCDARFEAPLLFSGLDSSVAGDVEAELAGRGHAVVSNARNHRMDPDVPLLIPEVNPDHLAALDVQRRRTGRGYIVTNPNCSVVGLAMALAPLHRRFGVESVAVVTLQALSGAGYPGVASLDVADNVLPYIGGGEEEKIEAEPRRILGAFRDGAFEPAPMAISASVHRVQVSDGHTMACFVRTREKAGAAAAREALAEFRGEPQDRELPTAPRHPIHVLDGADRPQPRLDRDRERGMAVSVGRVREDPVLGGLKLEALVHNTIRGAAGAAVLNAELLQSRGLLP